MRRHPGIRTARFGSTLLGTLLGAAFALVPMDPAAAGIDAYRVTGVGRSGLKVRTDPRSASASVVRTLANRTPVSIVCGVRARSVYGNTVWHRISAPATGWISDHYIDAPGSNKFIAGEPACAPDATARYRFTAAAGWATAHARDRQDYQAMCAWFASNVLWQGGLPKTSRWTDRASYRDGRTRRRGTVTANLVVGVRNHLLANRMATETPLGNLSTAAVPAARPGDLITYDWNGDNVLDHVAVVVSIAAGGVPEVAEWGSSMWPEDRARYAKRAWTWSENYHMPQQQRHNGKVRAYLLHITY